MLFFCDNDSLIWVLLLIQTTVFYKRINFNDPEIKTVQLTQFEFGFFSSYQKNAPKIQLFYETLKTF